MELEQQLIQAFSQTFNVPKEKISIKTKQDELEEWDSLGQLRLIMELEATFNISFFMEEIPMLDSFEKILATIQLKLKT
jgi:acyl carrier protein